MVPSVTDSPSSGISTLVPEAEPEDFFFAGLSSSAESLSDESASFSSAAESSSASSLSEFSSFSSASPITAITEPTSTVSSSSAFSSRRVPETGEGTSVSTLSVETSSNGSSASTVSPTSFSHWVMVPSVTDSPSSGISTECAMSVKTPLTSENNTEGSGLSYRSPTYSAPQWCRRFPARSRL